MDQLAFIFLLSFFSFFSYAILPAAIYFMMKQLTDAWNPLFGRHATCTIIIISALSSPLPATCPEPLGVLVRLL